MTSLEESYSQPLGAVWTKKQLAAAITLFITGVLMLTAAAIISSTEILFNKFGMTEWADVWTVAGVLAGLALPVMAIGIFTVLPSMRFHQFGAGVGIAIIIVAVIIFYLIFPEHWVRTDSSHGFLAIGLYLLGSLLTLGFIFDAIAKFRQRNKPGGTVTITYSDD